MKLSVRDPGAQLYVLPELLDLKAAVPLHQALLERRGAELDVDASCVRRLGGLCLQVVLSACSTWKADGHPLIFLNPSPAFVEGLQRLGVEHDVQ